MATKKNDATVLGVGSQTIKDYADFFSANDLAHLHIKVGEVEVEFSRSDYVNGKSPVVASAPMQVATSAYAGATQGKEASATEEAPVVEEETGERVVSPIVGTFYRSPSPDSPAFVKEGDHVSEDSVVCIVEAMKMMNELKAGVSGKVKKILVVNGESVTAGQSLFIIEKA